MVTDDTPGVVYKRNLSTGVTSHFQNFKAPLNGVWGDGVGNLWVVGDAGIWHYDGKNWIKKYTVSSGSDINAVYGFGAKDVWAVGKGGKIYRCQ